MVFHTVLEVLGEHFYRMFRVVSDCLFKDSFLKIGFFYTT